MIEVDNPDGPIIYSQIRIGKDGRLFKMYKFRSMVVDADKKLKKLLDQNEVECAMFKIKSDPRITKVGHILRKYSIDELPQLLNVLKGDMALVGPRPPLIREIKKYTKYDKQRLIVTPSFTGLWQVTVRNTVGFHEMVNLDLAILFRTIWILLKPNDAY